MSNPGRGSQSQKRSPRGERAAQQEVDDAAQAARKARRQFFDTLDRHVHSNATDEQLIAAAHAMWLSEKRAGRVSRQYRLKASTEPMGGPPKQRRQKKPVQAKAKKRAAPRDNLYGVKSVLPGSFEGGQRR